MAISAAAQSNHPSRQRDDAEADTADGARTAAHAAIAHAKKEFITIKKNDRKPLFGKVTPQARLNRAKSSLGTLENVAFQLELARAHVKPKTQTELLDLITTVQTSTKEQQHKLLKAIEDLRQEHKATAVASVEASATKFFADEHKKQAAAAASVNASATKFFADAHKKQAAAAAVARAEKQAAAAVAGTEKQIEKQWHTGGVHALGGGRRRKATRRRHSQKAEKARSNKKPRHNKRHNKKRRTKRQRALKTTSRTRSRQSMVGGWDLPEWLGGKKTEASDAYDTFAHNANALTTRNTQLMYQQQTAEANLPKQIEDMGEGRYFPVKGSSPDDRGIKDWKNKILARQGNSDAKEALRYHNERNKNSQSVNELSRHMSTLYPSTTRGMVDARGRATRESGDVFADGTVRHRTGREIRQYYDHPLGGGRRRTLRNRAK